MPETTQTMTIVKGQFRNQKHNLNEKRSRMKTQAIFREEKEGPHSRHWCY